MSSGRMKRLLGTGALATLVVGMVFPALIVAALTLWEPLRWLLLALEAPTFVVVAVGVVGAVSSVALGLWLCRLIWRYLRESSKPSTAARG